MTRHTALVLALLITSSLTACGPGGMRYEFVELDDSNDSNPSLTDAGASRDAATDDEGGDPVVDSDAGGGAADGVDADAPVEDVGSGGEDAAVDPGPMCGDGVRDPGETCDGDCPSTCDDGKACTSDRSMGSAQMCDMACQNDPITSCQDGDGCCAPGCNAANDDDCDFDCTDAASWPADWVAFEAEVVRLTNIERAQGADCDTKGVFAPAGPVTSQAQLAESARCHSLDMSAQNYFSHTGLNGSRFWERIQDTGYSGSAAGENIAAGQGSPASVVAGWMRSDGHCANIMKSGISEIGIGYVQDALIDDSNATGGGTDWPHMWTMVTAR